MILLPTAVEPVVRLCGVHVIFGGTTALCGVDLDVRAGEILAIAGPNGAGKSTLLEVVAGTRAVNAGTRVATASIAFVPQRTAVSGLLPVTVRDAVTVGAWGRTRWWRRVDAVARADIDDALKRLHIADLASRPFSMLSGGQRQRTLLAQGLARRADLLLLDEPTTGLDAASAERIRAVVRSEADRGAAIVCVSHDPSMLEIADAVVRLENGRVHAG